VDAAYNDLAAAAQEGTAHFHIHILLLNILSRLVTTFIGSPCPKDEYMSRLTRAPRH
jgi:hypothetical protein